MSIKLAVFDIAGTSLHDEDNVNEVLSLAMNDVLDLGITVKDTNPYMGIPKPLGIKKVLEDQNFSDINDSLIDKIHNHFVTKMIEYYQTSPNIREKDGFSDLCHYLSSKDIKIAIDTGFDRPITNAIINRLNWNELLDFSVTSDEVENGRPYKDMIIKAMDQFGITDKNEVAKIGDTANDVNEGLDAGVKYIIAITTGAHSKDTLKEAGPTHLIEHLSEIKNIL